jgi:hypothetical protein
MNKAINMLMQEETYLALALGADTIVIRFHLEKFNEATNLVRVRILTATSEDDYCSLQARRLSPP